MANYASKLIEVAEAEVGYLEKASNSNLDNKTGNVGNKNWTKYARDLAKISGFYNGNKNGYDWCDVFVDWCFVQAFGVEEAKKLINHGQYGAGCGWSSNYFRNVNRFYNTPEIGDVIFFGAKGQEYHTGIVYNVDNNKVYTIEGNTLDGSGVIASGGGVFKKSYSITDRNITGYGRPSYDVAPVDKPAKETTPVPAPPVQPTPTPSTEAFEVKAGKAILLRNEPYYIDSYTKQQSGTLYGTYYFWSSEVMRGRAKITTDQSKVGVKGQVLCWINVPDNAEVVYVVKRGDTLGAIAKKYNTTVKVLAAHNGIKNPDLILVGQKIRIP